MSMADLSLLLARLRTCGGPVTALASAVVQDVLGRPLGELLDAGVVAGVVHEAISALTASDAAMQRAIERVQVATAALAAESRSVAVIVPAPLAEGVRALAGLPATPSHDALVKLLDRPPIRRLLRAQVIETLAAFGRRAASPVADSSLARGLGGISKRALGQIASGPSATLSRMANAVSGEVERQVEKRAADFADTAVAGILAGIVDQATDAARTKEQAAVRIAIVDGLLEMTGTELSGLLPGRAASQIAAVRSALAAWGSHPDFAPSLETAIRAAMAEDARRSLGDLLEEFALRDVVAAQATGAVERALDHLFAGKAFERWLADLLAGE
jgi:hypothetical protein